MKNSIIFLFIAVVGINMILAQAPTAEWSKVYNLSYPIYGCSVHQTQEGNYIIGGYKNHPRVGYDEDCLIILADNNGDTLWTRLYGEENVDEIVVSFQSTFDGGYIIFSSKNDNLNLYKIDSNCNVLWEQEYNLGGWAMGKWGVQTSDSGYIYLFGLHNLSPPIHLIKTDKNGELNWHKSFNVECYALYNVFQTNNGGLIVSGNDGGYESFLLKLNEYGDSLWTKYYTTSHYGLHVLQTSDDGFLLTGAKATPVGGLYFIKTDEQGEITWTKLFTSYSGGRRSIEYSNGNFITVGRTYSDTTKNYLIKISDRGDSLWSVEWDIEEIYAGYPIDIKETADNGFIVLGQGVGNFTVMPGPIYLTKLTSGPNEIKELSQNNPTEFTLGQNYPNPCNPSTTIKYQIPQTSNVVIKVFDILGNEIETLVNEEKTIGNYTVEFDASKLSSGIYFYRIEADTFVDTKKMVLLK